MGNRSKTKGDGTNYKSDAIKTSDANEWLKMVEENGELIYCEKRSARMHSRNCDILRKSIPICSDTGYVDKTLKLVNVCNDCPVVFQKLSVRRFIEYRKEFSKKYG